EKKRENENDKNENENDEKNEKDEKNDKKKKKITTPPAHLFSCGVSGMVHSLPPSFTQQYIFSVSSDVTNAIQEWGSYLLQRTGKPSFSNDPTADNLGYWTDNGAYYYYNTLPGRDYAQTMIALADYHRQLGLNVCLGVNGCDTIWLLCL